MSLRGLCRLRYRLGGYSPLECVFDFVHQRVRKTCFAQLGEIGKNCLLPRLVPDNVGLAPVLKIERASLVDPPEEHESMRTVCVNPDFVGSEGNGLIGRFERVCEITGDDKPIG